MKFVYKLNIYNHDQKLLFKLPTIFSPLAPPKLIAYLLTVIFLFSKYMKRKHKALPNIPLVFPLTGHIYENEKTRKGVEVCTLRSTPVLL